MVAKVANVLRISPWSMLRPFYGRLANRPCPALARGAYLPMQYTHSCRLPAAVVATRRYTRFMHTTGLA